MLENFRANVLKECLSATPIGSWQSAVRDHQHTSWSVSVQKATVRYRLIPSNFSVDHGHHSSRSWACCSHSRWHSDHGQGWWAAYPESEHCSWTLWQLGLHLQLNKCKFMQRSITYMGCVISAEGISPTEDKVEAIKKAPHSENCTQLRAFLGMINYRRNFIHNLSSILQPLNQLLQKDQEFLWSSQCEEAFNKVKESLSSSHVLVHYNPSLPVILESDASQYMYRGCHASPFPQQRREAHRICFKILKFIREELQSNREGRPSHLFQCDQELHVPVWAQVHTSNWSQTVAEDLCSRLCHTCFGGCTSSALVSTPLIAQVRNWIQAFCWSRQLRCLVQTTTAVREGCQCRGQNLPGVSSPIMQTPCFCLGNWMLHCQKSSPNKGSCNDPKWLACPLLHHSWAQAILPPQGWALCRARLSDVGPANHYTSVFTGADPKWATQGTPRSCTHEGSCPHSCMVAKDRQRHQGESMWVQAVFQNQKGSTSSNTFPLAMAYSHPPVQPLSHYSWCSLKVA